MNNFNLSRIYYAFFATATLIALYIFRIGWHQPIMDVHGFRQTQTAISAYYFTLTNPFAYETPVLGPPWSIPFEFPLYQALMKGVSELFHYPLDQSGRAINVFFFLASLFPLASLLRKFVQSSSSVFMILGLYLLSPVYLFWSRTVMIESLAVFLSLSYLDSCILVLRERRVFWIVLAVVCGMLAALVKITTFFSFGFLFGVYYLVRENIFFLSQPKKEWIKKVVLLGVLTGIPLVAGIIWAKFADHQKMLNPLASFITSTKLTSWNFGTLSQKLSLATWKLFLVDRVSEAIGSPFFLLIVVIACWCASRAERILILSLSALYFFTFAVFTNLHYVHNYYQNSCAIFLMVALGLSIQVFVRNGKHYVALAMLAMVSITSLSVYRAHYGRVQKESDHYMPLLGEQVAKVTSPDDVIMIYGLDWSSELPYYSGRKAIMDRDRFLPTDPALAQSLKNVADLHEVVAALIICGADKNDPAFVKIRTDYFHLNTKDSEDQRCALYSAR